MKSAVSQAPIASRKIQINAPMTIMTAAMIELADRYQYREISWERARIYAFASSNIRRAAA